MQGIPSRSHPVQSISPRGKGTHDFIFPLKSVLMLTRYSFTDFAIGSAVRLCLDEGATDLGIHYDIMCHYVKHMWTRFQSIPSPTGPISRDLLGNFVASVPKFHLAGHVEACQAQFSLNNISGMGRLDGEGGERFWSNLNHASGSSSEKGPGSRIDAINLTMQQWTWCKTTGMGAYHDSTSPRAFN